MIRKEFIHSALLIADFKKGFTLVELLVTIGIIGVIFGIIINSASGIQKAGRDSQRQTDLRTIQQALQQYYADQNFYPRSSDFSLAGVDTTLDSCDGREDLFTCVSSAKKTYLSTIPKDPFGGSSYKYVAYLKSGASGCNNNPLIGISDTRCYKYCLYAMVENPSSALTGQCNNGDKGSYNFAVLQP